MIAFVVLVLAVVGFVMWRKSRRLGTAARPSVSVVREPGQRLRTRGARRGERL